MSELAAAPVILEVAPIMGLDPVSFKNPLAVDNPLAERGRFDLRGACDLGDQQAFTGVDMPSVEMPASVWTESKPVSRLRRYARALLLAGTVGTAGISVAACTGAPTAATSSPNTGSYNPADCVSTHNGIRVLDLDCAEKGFPAQLPSSILSLAESVVTVNIVPSPNPEQIYGAATGEVEGPNLVISAGHDDEILDEPGVDACSKTSSVDMESPDHSSVGVSASVVGLYDGFVPANNAVSKRNTDVSIIDVAGSAIGSLPDMPVDPETTLPVGTDVVFPSEQATFPGGDQHSPTSTDPTDRQITWLKGVVLGTDVGDPSDEDLASLGAYDNGNSDISGSIPGASGSAEIPLSGPHAGQDTGELVEGTEGGDYAAPAPDDALTLYGLSNTAITENGKILPPVGDGYQLIRAQIIPTTPSSKFISCDS